MIDNVEIAILTRLNYLAECHGFKPYQFIATLQSQRIPSQAHVTTLTFEVGPPGQANETRFDKLLNTLGVNEDGQLIGTHAEIINALDNAIRLAPKSFARK